MCIDKGMVSSHTQAIDSAPVKANASVDSLELKVHEQDLEGHLAELRHISYRDKEVYRKAKENKANKEQQNISANKQELAALKSSNKKSRLPSRGKNKWARYTSNKTYYSPTDLDARNSVKPGKARKLNYLIQLSVDTGHHVITDISAYHSDKKDNQYLQDIVGRLQSRLHKKGLFWRNYVADTGFSIGENYAYIGQKGLQSIIPAHGTYRVGQKALNIIRSKIITSDLKQRTFPSKRCLKITEQQP